jgi:hypothetical protein
MHATAKARQATGLFDQFTGSLTLNGFPVTAAEACLIGENSSGQLDFIGFVVAVPQSRTSVLRWGHASRWSGVRVKHDVPWRGTRRTGPTGQQGARLRCTDSWSYERIGGDTGTLELIRAHAGKR